MPITVFDTEKYSLIDVEEFLKNKGYEIEKRSTGESTYAMFAKGTGVGIDYPLILKNGTIAAAIRYEVYPEPSNYDENQKLFDSLKRKFGKSDETTSLRFIKDQDKIEVLDIMEGSEKEKQEKIKIARNLPHYQFDLEEHSIDELEDFFQSKGYQTENRVTGSGREGLFAKGTEVGVDFPKESGNKILWSWIHFYEYPRPGNYEECKSLYEEVVDKFAADSINKKMKFIKVSKNQ